LHTSDQQYTLSQQSADTVGNELIKPLCRPYWLAVS